MNKIRLSAFLLTLAVAVMSLGYMSSSFAGKKCDEDSNHPSCGGDDDPVIVAKYTATLITGGFRFNAVEITPNNRDTGYSSMVPLDMDRPSDVVDAQVWDEVFLECYEVLGSSQIPGVTIGTDWGITQGGKKKSETATNIRITFRTVVADGFPDVDIWIALITRRKFDRAAFFPADPGDISVYPLDIAKIYGDVVGNSLSCNSDEFGLSGTVNLVISRIE